MVKNIVQVLLDSNTQYTIYREKNYTYLVSILSFSDTDSCSFHSPQKNKEKKYISVGSKDRRTGDFPDVGKCKQFLKPLSSVLCRALPQRENLLVFLD